MFRTSLSAARICSHSQSLTTTTPLLPTVENYFSTTCAAASKRQIHSSSLSRESARKQVSRIKKRDHQAKRVEKQRLEIFNKPHPALGYSRGNERLWLDSKLASVILTEEMVQRQPIPRLEVEMEPEVITEAGRRVPTGRMVPKLVDETPVPVSVELPKHFNYGIDEEEKKLLFEDTAHLRQSAAVYKAEISTEHKAIWSDAPPGSSNFNGFSDTAGAKEATEVIEEAENKSRMKEQLTRYWAGRVLDLRNAGSGGLEFENRKRIIAAFSTPEKPHDPGRTEVQVALLTHRIHRLFEHLQKATRDIHNRKMLLTFLHDRASILKYLRRNNRARYEVLLPQIGVEKEAVEGEITFNREMLKSEYMNATWS